MECLSCGASAPGDPSTGYCADAICPRCSREGWELTNDGQLIGPDDQRSDISDLPRRMVRATLQRRARRTSIG